MSLSIEEISELFANSARQTECVGHKKKVHCLAWNQQGTLLASGSVDNTTRLWQFNSSGESVSVHELKGHSDSIDQLCWNPRRPNQLATTSSDKTVRIWDAKSGEQTHSVKTSGENINIAWSPDGSTICVGNKDDVLTFIETRRFKVVSETKFDFEANEFCWSPNSEYFFLTAGQSDGSGSIEIIKFSKHKLDKSQSISLAGHGAACYCLALCPTGRRLAVGAADSLVSLWDLDGLVCTAVVERLDWPVRTLGFSADGRLLAAAAEDHFVDICDAATGRRVHAVQCDGALNAVA